MHVETTDNYDRLVPPYDASEGPSLVNSVQRGEVRGASLMEVTAVRVLNGDMLAKIVRIYHDFPPSLVKHLRCGFPHLTQHISGYSYSLQDCMWASTRRRQWRRHR